MSEKLHTVNRHESSQATEHEMAARCSFCIHTSSLTAHHSSHLPVLMVDDEPSWLESFEVTLSCAGVKNIMLCTDSRKVVDILARNEIGVMLLDLNMPHLSGLDILSMVTQNYPDLIVIVLSGIDEVDAVVKCMRSGAFDYFVKTTDGDLLTAAVKRAIELRESRREYDLLKSKLLLSSLDHPEAFSEIVTQSARMRAIFQYTEAVAGTSRPVLITGETGTGKELMARAVHLLSGVKGPFVAVNIAGLDDNVFSDTLFGHSRGAFTGAHEARRGLVHKASGGTLFLDEIGDLSHASQVKLLRLVEEGEYFALGSDVSRQCGARLVFASQADMNGFQENGRFRKDLYYRLSHHHIHIPSLRERMEDIPCLVEHFLSQASQVMGKKKPRVPNELFALLAMYSFPGNVRELKLLIHDAVTTHKGGWLSMRSFKDRILKSAETQKAYEYPAKDTGKNLFSSANALPTLKEVSRQLVSEALHRSNGNRTVAAEMLGITRQALSWRLKHGERMK